METRVRYNRMTEQFPGQRRDFGQGVHRDRSFFEWRAHG